MRTVLKYVFITFLFFPPIHSFSQTKTTLQIFDSSRVCDGYVLRLSGTKCQLIDRYDNTLFNIPGNLVSFFNNKELIASQSGGNLVVFDKNLDVIWKKNVYVHHELIVTPDDNILLLTNERHSINRINVLFDDVLCFDSKGKKLFEWSTFDQRIYLLSYMMKDTNIFHYKIKGTSDPEKVLFKITPTLNKTTMAPGSETRELFHMNAIQVIPENESEKKDTVFRKGNILLCFCNYSDSLASFIAIVDPVNFKMLWHYVQKNGGLMHTPSMLPNGNILLYINSSTNVDSSFIEEINPLTKEVLWKYVEPFPDLWKRNGIGSCQRLPNGNTLISNNNGYVYEVTPEKEIVWQWFISDGVKPVYRAYFYQKEKLNWLINDE